MPIPNNPNSEISNTVPLSPTGTVSSIRLNFIRGANEIRLLQADITARQSASGATGPQGAAGPAGAAGTPGPTGAAGAAGGTGATGAKGPAGGGGGGGGGAIVAAVTSPSPTQPPPAGYPTGTLLALYTGAAVTRLLVRGAGGNWLTVYP